MTDKEKRAISFARGLQNNKLTVGAVGNYVRALTVFLKQGATPGQPWDSPEIKSRPEQPSGRGRETLLSYIGRPNTFVHFSDLEKLGLNPKSHFSTPLGIYGWPLVDEMAEKLEKGSVYGGGRSFAHIFQIEPPPLNLQELGLGEATQLLETLKEKYPQHYKEKQIEQYLQTLTPGDAFYKSVEHTIHHILQTKGGKATLLWNIILRDLGLSGVVDMGGDIIFKGEPYQGFALTGANVKHLETIDNPSRREVKMREYNKWKLPYDASEEQHRKRVERAKKYIQYVPPNILGEVVGRASPEDLHTMALLIDDSDKVKKLIHRPTLKPETLEYLTNRW